MDSPDSLEGLVTWIVGIVLLLSYGAVAIGSWYLNRNIGTAASRFLFGAVASLPVLYLLLTLYAFAMERLSALSARGPSGNHYEIQITFAVYCVWIVVCAVAFCVTARSMPARCKLD